MSRAKFKTGDTVVIVNPEFIVRVGYPISFDDAYSHVEKNFEPAIRGLLAQTGVYAPIEDTLHFGYQIHLNWPPSGRYEKPYKKIVKALALMYLENEGFGGKERAIHTVFKPELQDKIFEVLSKKVVKTGTYYPPWSHQSYEGEWDGGPGGLDNCKTHTVLELQDYTMYWSFMNKWDGCWIESCNVRKV
jgi:hypothetical protein